MNLIRKRLFFFCFKFNIMVQRSENDADGYAGSILKSIELGKAPYQDLFDVNWCVKCSILNN